VAAVCAHDQSGVEFGVLQAFSAARRSLAGGCE
jgi:hypothetical protein